MKRLAILAQFVSVSALVLGGCASDTGAPEPDQGEVSKIESALASPNGGFGPTEEVSDFADPEVAQLTSFDGLFADKTDLLAQAPATARVFKLVLLWGHLPNAQDGSDAQTVPQKIDWTGSVSVDSGAIGLSETLRFDDKDSVAPRTEAKSLSFVSRTYPAVDGLVLRVAVPASAQTLHFRTSAMNADIDLSKLGLEAGGVTPLGDGRNALAWVGFPDAPGCANGFVFGHWSKIKPGLGKLKASIYDDAGQRIGRAKGIWGQTKTGDKRLFFGKTITNDGAFKGLFGGTYAGGKLSGVWGNRQTGEGGGLRGFYSDGYDKTDVKGVWLGRWTEPCAR